MCKVLRHKIHAKDHLQVRKVKLFPVSLATASIREGLYGALHFPFSRPISRGRSCRGPAEATQAAMKAWRLQQRPIPPAHGPRHRNSFLSFSWQGFEVSLFVGLTADWNNKGNGSLQSFMNGLNENHKAWKFKGFGKKAVLFFVFWIDLANASSDKQWTALGMVYAIIRLVGWIGDSVVLDPPHLLFLQLLCGFITWAGGSSESLARLILLKEK